MPRLVAIAIAVVATAAAPASIALADPVQPPRVVHAPTARMVPGGVVHATAGASHRGTGTLVATAGLGDLAEIELGVADDLAVCDPCAGNRYRPFPAIAGFKIGTPAWWLGGRFGIAAGIRRTFAGRPTPWGTDPVSAAELYAVASARLGEVRVHAGAVSWSTRHVAPDGTRVEMGVDELPLVRPLAGIEWTPSIYPRSTFLADVSHVAELEPTAAHVRWIGAWGARYQALSWGSIELAVRHRGADELADTTVLVRLNGVFPRDATTDRPR
jgi:hypothetical protein